MDKTTTCWTDENPISAELFGPERFVQHAHSLAAAETIAAKPQSVYSLVQRMDDNAKTLQGIYRDICHHVAIGDVITPAAEWLIDNFHFVEEQIRLTRVDLPKGFYKRLSKLADGPFEGYPRIFAAAWAYVAHGDSHFSLQTLELFVSAYQKTKPFKIGEIWAMPIMLRLVLIENLRRLSVRMNAARLDRIEANHIADRVLDPSQQWADADIARLPSRVSVTFTVQLIHRLRDIEDARAHKTLDWLSAQLEALDMSLEQAVSYEHHRQAAANVTVRNVVKSLRSIADASWPVFFENISIVEQLLRQYPMYGDMDFRSRNIYRDAVECLARGSNKDEGDIVRHCLVLAGNSTSGTDKLGQLLIGHDRQQLEADIDFVPDRLVWLRRVLRRIGLPCYIGAVLTLTLAITAFTLWQIHTASISTETYIVLFIAAILPFSDVAVAIVNATLTKILDVQPLPALALRDGVPEAYRTLIAMPTMLLSHHGIDDLIGRLEAHYLASGEQELYFGLVTDWCDGDHEKTVDDDELLQTALQRIEELNQHYQTKQFLLLHRSRLWNPCQRKWMGWERKRGKLHELNRLLRGAKDTSFITVSGEIPANICFVITLDADTRLPHDAARRMIGKLAHPLNRPVVDAGQRRVVGGYAILQPRITASLPVGHYGSYFQRLYALGRGIDPYVFAASDLYQDMFGEGTYAGKGIYDIDAFEAVLANRFPDNAILSHDLIESVFARSALLTDVEVVEDFPERHAVAASRMHRWVRGDWQLLPWIFGKRRAGFISSLNRWKLIDNLRRSLLPLAVVAAMLAGWLMLPKILAASWTVAMILAGGIPTLLPAVLDGLRVSPGSTIRLHLAALWVELKHGFAVAAANLTFVAHYASLMLDAIGRTLFRLTISHKNLLNWTTAAQVEATTQLTFLKSYGRMWMSVATGLAVLAIVVARGLGEWYWILPFSAVWFLAPAAAHVMSFSAEIENELASSANDRLELRMVARRTWRFFEQYVTKDDNMLPPDNFQEDPSPVVAHRTSPTNIGLYLLSVVSAHEMGWIGLDEAIERLEATSAILGKMEIYRGHLLNWYDTQTLLPLEPRYVSTVDSGNLAGHLIALANCCDSWRLVPTDGAGMADGIGDIIAIINEEIGHFIRTNTKFMRSAKRLQRLLSSVGTAAQKVLDAPELAAMHLVAFAVISGKFNSAVMQLATQAGNIQCGALVRWSESLKATGESHFRDAVVSDDAQSARNQKLQRLAESARKLAQGMNFAFLYDAERSLLSIGYRVSEAILDENCYDMLASEARLASYVAIAKGDLRSRHWFRLGRSVTSMPGGAALLSWSGSMFEYLMPSLVMRAPTGGMLDQTTRLIVAQQIAYAQKRGIPWGISESASSMRDTSFTYQYSNYGVPGLGLKRGLADDLVVAPYATALAAMIAPSAALQNLKRLRKLGALGAFGYYEAIDLTPTRLPAGEECALVRAYFAHHQGMSIVAIYNAVTSGAMRAYFHNEPSMRASELLLQERAPRDVPYVAPIDAPAIVAVSDITRVPPRCFNAFDSITPETHLLCNGRYSVMLTAAGSGYSMWNGIAISRWREDATRDNWGHYFYIRDVRSARWWSAGHMPSGVMAKGYRAIFSEHMAEIERQDEGWQTKLECVVSSGSDVEARRITLTNGGLMAREIEFTSYVELSLDTPAADVAHPAFSKMFVTTEFLETESALIATRRQRSAADPAIWVAQCMTVEGGSPSALEFETDRGIFLGRCNDAASPIAMQSSSSLSGTVGTVLDPVFALRQRIKVPRDRQVRFTVWTLAAASREALIELIDQHRHISAFDRALTLAWTQAQIQNRHLAIDAADAQYFQQLAAHVIFSNSSLRLSAPAMAHDLCPQSTLWRYGISGDRPIVLLRINNIDDLDVVKQMLQAFEYWRFKNLPVDLVILNDRTASYIQDLQSALEGLVRRLAVPSSSVAGELKLLRADLMIARDVLALAAASRVILHARRGRLGNQLAQLNASQSSRLQAVTLPLLAKLAERNIPDSQLAARQYPLGTFSEDGKEYIIRPTVDKPTPAPWANVVANAQIGFLATAEGAGNSWYGNSREFQLTPWYNDPVSCPVSEAFYVFDKKSLQISSPTLLPVKNAECSYDVRHGFGYSSFASRTAGLMLELTQFVAPEDAVKVLQLTIINSDPYVRKFAVTFFAELALAANRASSLPYLVTEINAETGALFVKNRWSQDHSHRVCFIDMAGAQNSLTADRREFIGQYGSLAAPYAVRLAAPLSGRVGAGLDPVGAMQTEITVEPGESKNITVLLGAAEDEEGAQKLVLQCRGSDPLSILSKVKTHWNDILTNVQVKTPDHTFDVMMNGWLLYQTLVCRMWGRSGFYQASGAFGYRDQLQDSLALLWSRPDLTREHILRAAGRQFPEGDVQHWWLPESGKGIRSRISDDSAWLAYCTAHYVATTGDTAILDENIAFIDGQKLEPGAHECFFLPHISEQCASLLEHCVLGLEHAMATGSHGLPLIGTGDWNDGMNRVGEKGQGESIWLGWFLVKVLTDFMPLLDARDDARGQLFREKKRQLIDALEKNGWDGAWYRRAFFDDGTPLGSVNSQACKIDQIAQSWAVISGCARPERARQAMESVSQELIKSDEQLALLFKPPFDNIMPDPGYVQSYPPGIRENGGQYTHGAIWSIFAFAALGESDKAWELFAMLNPANHAANPDDMARYRVEPYVVAADIYSVEPHTGRGGWTWYTGAAGWLYRAGLEAILGFSRRGATLRVQPCLPRHWPYVEVCLHQGPVKHTIEIRRGTEFRSHHPAACLNTDHSFTIDLAAQDGPQHFLLEIGQ